ncbi:MULTISPECIES: potassium channel family protein [unclassified Nocardioides]|uniref:potassium channel family protein n=1 Tax=unclassified Nocardioides TaxID=2615069 RepID=UPI00361813CA
MSRFRVVERQFTKFLRAPLSVRRAMAVIVTATFVSVVAGGILIRLLDPEEFPDLGTGLWWSLQTVTTVGYGDVVPQDAWGRVIGAVIMLESIAFVAIATAAITSNFVERARRQSAAAAGDADVAAELAAMRAQLDLIQRRLDELGSDRS